MEKIFAEINQKWEPLSTDHKKLESFFKDILDAFSRGEDIHPSYLITGVFGQGKTAFLYHVLRGSIEIGILSIFVIARDIFENIKATDYGKVREEINGIVKELKDYFQKGDFSKYRPYIRSLPERSQEELVEFYQRNLDKISHSNKVILLIDELEDVYKKLKEKAGSDPLRMWLEDKSYLKILSLTPSGIYDLGGADESRLKKWTIPPVSIEYIRKNIENNTGKANALWWLSRGVPRHIIQNLVKLKELSEEDDSYKISETLKSLERIGKEPGRVNAVEIGSLSDHSKIKYLINLIPQKSQPYRGFLITKDLDEGALSNAFQGMFSLSREEEKDLALTIAHYFKQVAMAISDEKFIAYVKGNEIIEFMELALDILLENKYKSPVVEENMAKLLGIYDKLRSDPNLLLLYLSTGVDGISVEDVDKEMPFTINEIRRLFPFPMANPIIRSNPDDVFKEVEGKQKPVCKNDAFIFFASYRDFEKYLATDEFKNAILPEGRHFVILLPEDDFDRYEKVVRNPTTDSEQLLKWLLDNKKLSVVKSPPSIRIFLLSLYGYENRIPYNIDSIAENIKMSQESLLKRRFELYYTALNELVEDNKLTPRYFFKDKVEPKGLSDVWGVTQLKEEDVAVAGLALSFYNLPPNDKANLISLRELFKTKERRGDLADIKVGKGLPTLADDLLPRRGKREMIINDAPSIENLKSFWTNDERRELEKLSTLLGLSEFSKLHENNNYKRILEAFWRATRDEFSIDGINELKRRLKDVNEKLQFIQEVEKKSKDNSKLDLIFEESQENAVKALDGLKKLVELSFVGKLPIFILKLYLEATLDRIENLIINLHKSIQRVNEKLQNLNEKVDGIINNLSGKKEILEFISDKISFEDIKQKLKNLMVINNDLNLSDAEQEIDGCLSSADTILTKIGELENKLSELKQKLSEHNLLEVR
jgi:hypothetical protein